MAKVAVLLADGFEEIEGLTTVDCLRRVGIEVIMVSIMGRKAVCGGHDIRLDTDVIIEDVDFSQVDAVVLPGGLTGTNNLKANATVQKVIREFNNEGKLVAAICAAPSILGEAGLLEGKQVTAYPGFEESLLGATYLEQPAVVDGNIITGRGMGASIDFALAIVEYFQDADSANKLAQGIMFR